jgi:hypothetical protein
MKCLKNKNYLLEPGRFVGYYFNLNSLSISLNAVSQSAHAQDGKLFSKLAKFYVFQAWRDCIISKGLFYFKFGVEVEFELE